MFNQLNVKDINQFRLIYPTDDQVSEVFIELTSNRINERGHHLLNRKTPAGL